MTWRARFVAVLALLGACLVAPRVVAFPLGGLPNLIGSWEGVWSGVPMTLVITEQRDQHVAGIVTLGLARGAVSTAVQGRLGTRGGGLVLVLSADSTVSHDRYDFVTVQADRLEGHARSFGPGGHQGVVTLRRRPA
ncbi:MAG: hypothetical protein ACREM3_19665 [Candidatus Rokuibacteriota bacterium]